MQGILNKNGKANSRFYLLKKGVIQNNSIKENKSGNSTITHNNGNITLELPSGNGTASLTFNTASGIDLTKYNSFHCHFKSIRANYYYQTYMKSGVYQVNWYQNLGVEVMDMSLPIIDTTSLAIGYGGDNSGSKIEVYDMWLE